MYSSSLRNSSAVAILNGTNEEFAGSTITGPSSTRLLEGNPPRQLVSSGLPGFSLLMMYYRWLRFLSFCLVGLLLTFSV